MIKPRYCLPEPTKFDTNNCQTAILSHQTYQIRYRKLSNRDTVSLNLLNSTCKVVKLRYCLNKPIELLSHGTYYIWYETWSKCDTVSRNASTGKIKRKKCYETYVFYCRKWSVMHWRSNESAPMTIIHCKTPKIFLGKNEKQEKSECIFSSI